MSKWTFKPHQVTISEEAIAIVKVKGFVYLDMEERTRKSGIALLICERLALTNILIVAPAKALPGWREHIDKLPVKRNYTIVSMDSLHTLVSKNYDLVIVDEAHNFGSTTRTKKKGSKVKTGSSRRQILKRYTKGKLVIFISATPSAQGFYQLYEQLNISSWSPWKHYKNFYKWFEVFGIPETVYTPAGPKIKREKVHEDKIKDTIRDYFVSYTRRQLGFEHEPEDKVHYVETTDRFKSLYNALVQDKVVTIGDTVIKADSKMSLRTKLHQLEGGTIKYAPIESDPEVRETLVFSKLLFKIDYIKTHWGDKPGLVIMYNYIAEGVLLREHFKYATILQGTSYAEGVNLSHLDHMVVYSMDFKTVKYIQRRARQCDMFRDQKIIVHYLLIKNAISDEVYKTVAKNKCNYTDKYYNGFFL